MKMYDKIKHIFYDFDGVLAESLEVKSKAFYNLYLPFGESIAKEVLQHHLDNGGMSRYEKFKLYHKTYLNEDLNEEGIEIWAQKFSELVVQGVIDSTAVPGAHDFLEDMKNRTRSWIITGTPTEEMKKIAKHRGVIDYFEEICGSPKKKFYWTEYLIEKNNLDRSEILFLGDANSDYNAATKSNLNFALREHKDNLELFKDYDGVRFKDFNELRNYFK